MRTKIDKSAETPDSHAGGPLLREGKAFRGDPTEAIIPEKARLLRRLKEGKFNVPEFIYVTASDFKNERFGDLAAFLKNHRESFKVIARSAHPLEEFYRSGTFNSVETYADLAGIQFARTRIIHLAKTEKRLSIIRQQRFYGAPEVDLDDMGILVMPFIDGTNVMAKMLEYHWEFGYCRDRVHKTHSEPFITTTPYDRGLLQISQDIQDHLGFRCEIEFIVSGDGEAHVVQAKDISHIETLLLKQSERSITLDGVKRIRKRRDYRERTVYVMDTRAFYLRLIDKCEGLIAGGAKSEIEIDEIMKMISSYEAELEDFALKHQRFAVLGLSIRVPDELYQAANHCFDGMPELQGRLSKALHDNLYRKDYFLSEADTIIARDIVRVNLCGHDAYGIDTVRNPIWSVYWDVRRHEQIVEEFKRLGFKTGDTIGIDIGPEETPVVFRL